ncbi:nuclease [Cenarchaeum symbiosum A]|uniref:Nuclease n=1 Tax=Cenarchaeum symbiosum (strain A) TaxID=414004 RepID=A0RTZ2_CENSY|nr:nuclease [Cenarchaeum symbiosum A]
MQCTEIPWIRREQAPLEAQPGHKGLPDALYGMQCSRACMNADELYSSCVDGPDYSITGAEVFRYAMSPFFYYCEKFADRGGADPPPGNVKGGSPYVDDMDRGTALDCTGDKDCFRECIRLMFDGQDEICNAPLLYLPEGIAGRPDILRKAEGRSIFGGHYYAPALVIMALKPRRDHEMQAAFYSYLLHRIQGRRPEFTVVDGRGGIHDSPAGDNTDSVPGNIEGMRRIDSGHVPPAEVLRRPWTSYSIKKALETGHLSLVLWLDGSKIRRLERSGIRDVSALAGTTTSTISSICRVDRRKAGILKGMARAAAEQKPIVFKDPEVDDTGAKSFLAVETERIDNRIEMSGAAVLVRDESGERRRTFEGDGMMDGISGFVRGSTVYYWGRRALTLAESSGGQMPRGMRNLMEIFAESITFHLPLVDPEHISREMGHPVENSVPGECIALRNIHDWLLSKRGQGSP